MSACLALIIIAIAARDEQVVPAVCRGHTIAQPGAPTAEAEWPIHALRTGRHSVQELFQAEPRDPVWSAAMEAAVRRLVSPAVADTPGLELTGLCCHRTGCRMVLRVAPELRKQLIQSASVGTDNPFATPNVWAKAGFPARVNWINFDPKSGTGRAARQVGRAVESVVGFDPILDYQLERLMFEESIFLFDRSNHVPEDALAAAVRSRNKRAQSPARP